MNDPISLLKDKYNFLSEEEIEELLQGTKIVQLEAGDYFIESGEMAYQVGLVLQGLMRNFHSIGEHGEEKTTLFRAEGESVGAYSTMFMDKPATENSVALEDSILAVLDFQHIRALSKKNRNYAEVYIKSLEENLVDAITRIDGFTLQSPEQRFLEFRKNHPDLLTRIPQKYLASFLGVTPISLSRIKSRVTDR